MNFLHDIAEAVRTIPARGRRNPLKILTLGTGLAVGLVLTSKVCFETTYDDFYDGADRICYICEAAEMNGEYKIYSQTSGGIAPRMKEYFPQVEEATRMTFFESDAKAVIPGTRERVHAGMAALADSSFFKVLTRECLAGDITGALGVEGNAAVSFSTAKKLASALKMDGRHTGMSAEDVIGERFTVAGRDGSGELTVCGVYEDYPMNSSFRPDIVVSLPSIGRFIFDGSDNVIGNDRYTTLLKLNKSASMDGLAEGFPGFIETYLPVDQLDEAGFKLEFIARSLEGRHNSDANRRNMTLLLGLVAFALLLTAVFNYLLVVLSTTVTRSREMALRKCLGSGRAEMFGMMGSEALVHTVLACMLAAALIFASGSLIEEVLGVGPEVLFRGKPLAAAGIVVALLLAVNSVLPTWIFNRIPVAAAFRNYSGGKRRWKLALLSVEFAAVGFLGVLIGVMSLQYKKMSNADLGFDYGNLAMISVGELSPQQKNALMAEIEKLPEIKAAAFGSQNPFGQYSGNNVSLPGDARQLFNIRDAYYVDGRWFDVLGVEIVGGRGFDTGLPAGEEVMVDEKFDVMIRNNAGWDEAVGKDIAITEHGATRICGIFKTINQGSFSLEDQFFASRPMAVFFCDPQSPVSAYFQYIFARYRRLTPEALESTRDIADRMFPDSGCEVTGCRKLVEKNFESTRNTRNAALIGGAVALIIALLGLVGYTVDEVRRRSKEIAVRRINGAQFMEIRRMFLRDVAVIAVPSVAAGCILAGFAGANWESQFTLQAGLPWWLFVAVAAAELLLVALLCDIYVQTVANRNPVDSIKTE